MLALCSMLSGTYYAQNYAIIITRSSVKLSEQLKITKLKLLDSSVTNCYSFTNSWGIWGKCPPPPSLWRGLSVLNFVRPKSSGHLITTHSKPTEQLSQASSSVLSASKIINMYCSSFDVFCNSENF